uniref:Uncharacterized protein n=1 Tax=Chrysotila carterae TaxID=13221 RepID=A0A7S4B0A6_CHRCT
MNVSSCVSVSPLPTAGMRGDLRMPSSPLTPPPFFQRSEAPCKTGCMKVKGGILPRGGLNVISPSCSAGVSVAAADASSVDSDGFAALRPFKNRLSKVSSQV